MKIVRKLRYYCDFCKKSGASAYHMRNHEKHCTLNPDRECRMCSLMDNAQKSLQVKISLAEDKFGIVYNIAPLREHFGNCPACILAYIRQNKIDANFIYKEEVASFFKDYNDEKNNDFYVYY